MPTSITPVLSSTVGYLKDVNEQISTLIRFVIHNPGWTSSLWEESLISFRKTSSEYDSDRQLFASVLSDRIGKLLSKKFQEFRFETDFQVSSYLEGKNETDDDGRYTIAFKIMIFASFIPDGIPGLVSGTITVDDETKEIKLSYDKTPETLSFDG